MKKIFFTVLSLLLMGYLQEQKKEFNPSYEKTVNDLLAKMTVKKK